MVAEEGLTVSGVQEELKSDPPFAKTKSQRDRPPQKKTSQNHFGVLTGGHPRFSRRQCEQEKDKVKTRTLKTEGCGTQTRPSVLSLSHPPVTRQKC
jgi:hypothetical protein